MGGHKIELPKVPDWRSYRVEDAPKLLELQNALAQHGLRDPWLRNEVWKFTEGLATDQIKRAFSPLRVGFKKGVIAGIITAALEMALIPVHHKYDEAHDGPHH